MYTVYFILVIVIIVSFITGNIVLFAEHKLNKNEKTKSKKETIKPKKEKVESKNEIIEPQKELEKSVVLENTIITGVEVSENEKTFFDEPILIPLEVVEENNFIIDEELL